MKIAILLDNHSSAGGGCEKFATHLANYLFSRQHQVSLITLNGTLPGKGTYRLDEGVKAAKIDFTGSKRRKAANFLSTVDNFRPDVIITLHIYSLFLSLWFRRRLHCAVIYSERGNPYRYIKGGMLSPIFWIYRMALFFCDHVILQTNSIFQCLFPRIIHKCGIAPRCAIIANPLIGHSDGSIAHAPIIMAASRLVESKGLNLLISAFARLAPEFPDWTLQIVGSGPELDALRQQSSDLGLQDKISFFPPELDLGPRMRSASVFVLASFHEGFPNVLLEAMSNGCAIVASNCDFGPGEIIEHGANGLLFATGSVLDCAQKIRSLLMDAQLREKLGNNAKATAQRYAAIPIFEQWERIINDAKEQTRKS